MIVLDWTNSCDWTSLTNQKPPMKSNLIGPVWPIRIQDFKKLMTSWQEYIRRSPARANQLLVEVRLVRLGLVSISNFSSRAMALTEQEYQEILDSYRALKGSEDYPEIFRMLQQHELEQKIDRVMSSWWRVEKVKPQKWWRRLFRFLWHKRTWDTLLWISY